jgi:rhodanese-related sulfurtransferase
MHNSGFLKLVEALRPSVQEITWDERETSAVLLDVREDLEFEAGHATGAIHMGRGVLERDIESAYPDKTTVFEIYCGGGFRSILACETLRQMGYDNTKSIIGGYKSYQTGGSSQS